ncbi:MAG: Fe-S cluster assembly protein SufB [Acidimicrobiia bacterium]|nr:Fe-S cluster assembly protein SufB [Acidimicrobiia bacterium]
MPVAPEPPDLEPNILGRGEGRDHSFTPTKGLSEEVVRQLSRFKGEPAWMLDIRLQALHHFEHRPRPDRHGKLDEIDFDEICYIKPVPGRFAVLGADAEGHNRAGVAARHESEAALDRGRQVLERQGVVFGDMDTAVREHPELVRDHIGTIVPPDSDPLSALNSAVWSVGWFIYVPPGVEVDVPLAAPSRTNPEETGQFERTLIIADSGSTVHYMEGCSAPVYTSDSLHSAVVEIVVRPGARVTCTTIQNWSSNVCNVESKRARVEAQGHMTWVDGNIGSCLSVIRHGISLVGPGANGEVLSVAYAGVGQHHDIRADIVHAAPGTSSRMVSKSISKDGGRSSHRGLVRVEDDADGCRGQIRCDALLLDDHSFYEPHRNLETGSPDARIEQVSRVSKVAAEQLFYLLSRGLSQAQAIGMVVNGFIEPVTRILPVEYAVEWSRLIELQLEGSVG